MGIFLYCFPVSSTAWQLGTATFSLHVLLIEEEVEQCYILKRFSGPMMGEFSHPWYKFNGSIY